MWARFNRSGAVFLPVAAFLGFGVVPTAQAKLIFHATFHEGNPNRVSDVSGNRSRGQIHGNLSFVASPGGRVIRFGNMDENDLVNFGHPALLDFTTQDFTIEMVGGHRCRAMLQNPRHFRKARSIHDHDRASRQRR